MLVAPSHERLRERDEVARTPLGDRRPFLGPLLVHLVRVRIRVLGLGLGLGYVYGLG